MGLAGRKVKQRIGNDPRNLSWADDAAKFGQSYLSKFGWDSSRGLGAEGAGRTSAIKVSQKLDMLGIGMQHQNNPDGIAWRQNKDFENLLKRLNGAATDPSVGVPDGFHRAAESGDGSEDGGEKGKKRAAEGDESGEGRERKKRKKEEKAARKAEKAAKKQEKARRTVEERLDAVGEPSSTSSPPLASAQDTVSEQVAPLSAPLSVPLRTHRARHLRMKRLAASTPTAMSEILGIASSSASPVPTNVSTPIPEASLDTAPELSLDKLTTSVHSVSDYFKAKLAAKTGASLVATTGQSSTMVAVEEETVPRAGLGMSTRMEVDKPAGLGFTSSKFAAMFAPKAAVELKPAPEASVGGDLAMPEKDGALDLDESHARETRKKEKVEKKRSKAERKASSSAIKSSSNVDAEDLQDGIAIEDKRTSRGDSKRKKKRHSS